MTAADVEVVLTPKEFDVLVLLATRHGSTVSRDTIMKRIWDPQWFGSTKTLDATVGRLRAKLGAAGASERVVAVRGAGFRLETD